jgi:hypothetical protein
MATRQSIQYPNTAGLRKLTACSLGGYILVTGGIFTLNGIVGNCFVAGVWKDDTVSQLMGENAGMFTGKRHNFLRD